MRPGDWLLGRAVLKRLLDGADTADIRFPNRCLSLTHSGGLAVAVRADGDQVGVGVDYEPFHPIDPRIARFFVCDGEDGDLLQLWTVKEALFKATPDNSGAVLRDYLVTGPDRAIDERGNTFRYRSRRLRHGWLTVAVCP